MMRNLLVALVANGVVLAANPVKDAVPLFFIANHGQAPPAVRFMAKGSGLTAYFSPGEALFRVAGRSVRMQFEQANPSPRVEGIERLPGHANFLIGEPRDWRSDVPLYGAVVYRELYPGIDMVYGGEGRDLKSEFVVAAGADPSRIRIRYAGAGGVRIEEDGALAIQVDERELREQAPSIYQERSGHRVAVEGRFAVDGDGVVRFLVGDYDVACPLIIDPVLVYSTLLGGSGFNTGTALAVDSVGAAYVAGFTDSYNFPTANPEQNFNAGGNDAFVAKFNSSGNELVYCTYVGGSADDRAYGIAVDGSGSAYVTGMTISGNFPVRNALQSYLAGGRNAFVLKLNPAGNTLVYSTYLGGNGSDNGNGIAVDAEGDAYVVGDTTSINFPATGFQRGNHGAQDAFVAKLNPSGNGLVYSTYLGGGSNDRGAGIAVDASGSAYITGSTYSTDFPVANAFQSSNGGGQDAFIARLSADGNSLVFSTYLGGTGGIASYPEAGQGIALDSQGNAYVTGVTSSANFPLLDAVQSSLLGSLDAFVAKVNASGTLAYSTYLGGSGVGMGNAIAVDSGGNAYVVGYTYSTDLPVTANALQTANAGDCDAFVAKLNAAGSTLVYLSYLGGNSSDTATAVALDTSVKVYVAGWTLSTNFPLLNPYQSATAANYGAFVTKMTLPSPVLSIASLRTGNFTQGQAGATYTVTVTNQSGALATSGVVTVTETPPAGITLVAMTGLGWTCASNVCTRSDALAAGASYPAITVTVNVAANAPAQVTNQVGVSGGGSASAGYGDPTTIIAVPVLSIGKTADAASVGAGTAIGYTVTVSNSNAAGTGTATSVTLTDPLPPGTGISWSISPAYSGTGTCSITGAAGSQTLGCNFGNLAAGASASVHVTSGTSASSCAGYLNTAAATASNNNPVQSSATTTVLCPVASATSIWPVTAVPENPSHDDSPATTGVKFRSDVSGNITGIRFYKGVGNNGTHIGLLYSSSGTLLAQAAFSGETASGWQQVSFSTPVPIAANTTYVAAYFRNSAFAYDSGYFTSTGVDNPPLHALRSGVDGLNGVYAYGTSPVFPVNSWDDTNYWVDIVFSPSGSATSSPDLTITKSHVGNFTQGQTGAIYTITATNSGNEPTSGTVTVAETLPAGLTAVSMLGTNWACTQPAGPCSRSDVLAAGSSYEPIAMTVNVSSTAPASVTNTVSVSGGGETNTGNDQATDPTTITITTPPTGTATSIWPVTAVPENPSHDDSPATTGVKFRSDVSGNITGIRFYKGVGNNGTHIGLLYSSSGTLLAQAAFSGETASGWQQVNLPTPVPIAANTTYVAAYFRNSAFAYDSGYFTSTGVDNPPLHALRSGVDGLNGVYAYGTSPAFPVNSWDDTNYWVDIVFSPN